MTSENGNFTPVFHLLAKEVGLVCAAVYGTTWRHCQMKDNNCKASLDTLGDEIGVDRATVMRSIKKLCELGYLVDQTPGRRNAPHTYILGKTVAECNTLEAESIAQGNSSNPTVAHSNATVAECNATVAESHLKIDSKETLLRESKRERVAPARKKETQFQKLERIGSVDYLSQNEPVAVKLTETCGNPHPRYVSNGKRKELAESVAQLVEWGVTTEQIQAFKDSYWWADDPPRYRQVVDEWGRFLTSKESAKQYPNGGSNGTTILERGKTEGGGLSPTSAAVGAALLARARPSSGGT